MKQVTVSKEDAIKLVQETLDRLNTTSHFTQFGGMYWRLAQVLSGYIDPQLEHYEGKEHSTFLKKTHGRIVK